MTASNTTIIEQHEPTLSCPPDHTVIKRKANFDFRGKVKDAWTGNAFVTRYFDAMQTFFPAGERMFIQSVRHYKDLIEDPELQEQIKAFIYQEGQHGYAHDSFNEVLAEQGIDIDSIMERHEQFMTFFQERFPKKFQLAVTVAAEHLTATMSEDSFNHDFDILGDQIDIEQRSLHMWHSMEEIEHKAVAWDVYHKATDGDYATRVLALAFVLVILPVGSSLIAADMLNQEKKLFDFKEMTKGLSSLLGKNGMVSRMNKPIARFLDRDFHPWQTGYPKGFMAWKKAYEETGDIVKATAKVYNAG